MRIFYCAIKYSIMSFDASNWRRHYYIYLTYSSFCGNVGFHNNQSLVVCFALHYKHSSAHYSFVKPAGNEYLPNAFPQNYSWGTFSPLFLRGYLYNNRFIENKIRILSKIKGRILCRSNIHTYTSYILLKCAYKHYLSTYICLLLHIF